MKKAIIASLLALSACSTSADTFPLNQKAQETGAPHITITREGSEGPVLIVMPDGEQLHGTYRFARSGAVGYAFSNGQSATAIAAGAGTVMMIAYGPKTEMLCQGWNGTFGHGSGKCETEGGAIWAVDW